MKNFVTAEDMLRARRRLLRMHYESGVGHIGGNLSSIDAMMVLFHEYIGADDAFILSKGHSAGALYTTLWTVGRLSDQDLETFHKDDTKLPGHPPVAQFPDILFATGSLGHGLSLAAGTALGMRMRGCGGNVFCLTSDGEWQEGSTWEALIFAAHQKLSNLTVLIDHNRLQGFGATDEVASMAPIWEKISGFGIPTKIVDGHDPAALRGAIDTAPHSLSIIVLETIKGHGVSFMENRMDSHYLPLTREQFLRAHDEVGELHA